MRRRRRKKALGALLGASWSVGRGDCLDWLRLMPDCSVDSVVTDPPAGIGFMNRAWDHNKGGRSSWVAWFSGVMKECLRVLKPGGHAVVWALPRTSHWTATAIEDAGFEVRDVIYHGFGTGFPKSLNVSKAIDELLGAERRIVGDNPNHRAVSGVGYEGVYAGGNTGAAKITAAATPEAKRWDGFGTAVKPSVEHWILARKPLDGTVAANVLEHGTGVLNIDGCRISTGEPLVRVLGKTTESASGWKSVKRSAIAGKDGGRWPANVLLSHDERCVVVERTVVRGDSRAGKIVSGERPSGFVDTGAPNGSTKPNGALHGDAEVDVYACVPSCAVRMLDHQAGVKRSGGFSDNGLFHDGMTVNTYGKVSRRSGKARPGVGPVSRFFYVSKPNRKERDLGLAHMQTSTGGEATIRRDGSDGLESPRAGAGRTGGSRNTHPTLKGIDLMRWLCRLVTPPGGVVLDPFCGSGSTGCAAVLEGLRFLGFELDDEGKNFVGVAKARLSYWEGRR